MACANYSGNAVPGQTYLHLRYLRENPCTLLTNKPARRPAGSRSRSHLTPNPTGSFVSGLQRPPGGRRAGSLGSRRAGYYQTRYSPGRCSGCLWGCGGLPFLGGANGLSASSFRLSIVRRVWPDPPLPAGAGSSRSTSILCRPRDSPRRRDSVSARRHLRGYLLKILTKVAFPSRKFQAHRLCGPRGFTGARDSRCPR